MPFHFSLDEVLEHRVHIEELRRRELHEIQEQVENVEHLLGEARRLRTAYHMELGERVRGGLAYASQEIYRTYMNSLSGLIRKSEEHLANLQQEFERRRLRLVEAAQAREVLDNLRKEELKRYLLEEERRERKVFDEIGIRQFLLGNGQKIPN